MSELRDDAASGGAELGPLLARFEDALSRLERTSAFAKTTAQGPVLDLGFRVLMEPGGSARLYPYIGRADRAGVFAGTDWERPEMLQPRLAAATLEHGDRATVTLELFNQLRMLAVSNGEHFHLHMPSENARHFLAQVLALRVDELFGPRTEAAREAGARAQAVQHLLEFVAETIGYGHILDNLVGEIERILAQRPIMLDHVKTMITRVAATVADPERFGSTGGVDRLVSALYGPTTASREDPGVDLYRQRLEVMDDSGLQQEARGFALAMHNTGLVSPYHEVFLHHVNDTREDLVAQSLGLSRTGADALSCYHELVTELIRVAVTPDTLQAIYGLALLLERGVLFDPAVSPALWGQITAETSATTRQVIGAVFGTQQPASTVLLAAILSMLGQPLGIGQGNNPTCQAARALSMWALVAPDYLLHLVRRAARDDEIVLFFEGQRLSSAALASGMSSSPLTDVDAVSLLLVPHLDRVYVEMGRRCAGRDGDPHAWINREMHGWWVGRETALAVDLPTGALVDFERFVRRFYAHYHPMHNGNQPVIHPQPVGIAATDSMGRFIGWHAISILRVGLGPAGAMRVYFFNPNNDSAQDWGHDVVVSTEGYAERFGESSLPMAEFASRLYLFHYDPCDEGALAAVPDDEVARVEAMARASWARDR